MKIFIDGSAGTTGLQLENRLKNQTDVTLIRLNEENRKNDKARREAMCQADAVFFCLPDAQAKEAAAWVPKDTLLIDASTAHRTHPDWVYGLPELSKEHAERVARSKRIAVPGCHATGFNLLVYPLIASGLLPRDTRLSCTSLTGYSGGGKAMIERYETDRRRGDALSSPRPYALGLSHKHLPEMQAVCGLTAPPLFMPVVGDIRQGMLVSVPLWREQLTRAGGAQAVWERYAEHYDGCGHVRVLSMGDDMLDAGALDATACNDTDDAELMVFGNDTQMLLVARLDNLGKGASGAAVQCFLHTFENRVFKSNDCLDVSPTE